MKQTSKRVLNRITQVMLLVGGMYSGVSVAATDQTDSTEQCIFEPSWLQNGRVVRPNDATFPNDPDHQNDPSNCNFHQWSWQMFLWLMDGDDGKPRFLDFATPQSLLGLEQRGLMPRTSKKQHGSSLDEYLQAGTDGILVDQDNRAVYYSQYVNQTFADFIQGKLGGSDLTKPDNVLAMNPTTEFPIQNGKGALELKASWKVVAPGEKTDGLFTMKKDIAKFVNTPSGIKIDPTKVETQTLALVGFHIGGIVANHPEMIWATFEFNNNAPDVPDGMKLDQVVSDKDYMFYKKGTQLGNCNKNASVSGLEVEDDTQKFTPVTQVCRRYAYGNQADQKQGNTNNIKMLNDSVWKNLPSQLSYLKNYFEVGAIWINNEAATKDPLESPLKPGLNFATDDYLTGSLRLSNSTIETYTQSATAMNNCFRCHNTEQAFAPKSGLKPLPATNLNISHAFQNIFFWSQEKDKAAAMAYVKSQGEK
ncbi:hypothetical protein [Pseudoalteromonas xiamenensis]